MKVGYARTSTVDQAGSLDSQFNRLVDDAGCGEVFYEQVSGAAEHRPKLQEALRFVRKGDALVVTKLDRAARSTWHLNEMIRELHGKGATLEVLDMNLDTGSSQGKLVIGVLGEIAEFERNLMRERQREGIERAKRQEPQKYQGRQPTARRQADEVRRLRDQGWAMTKIARHLGISRSSAYRCLEAGPAERGDANP